MTVDLQVVDWATLVQWRNNEKVAFPRFYNVWLEKYRAPSAAASCAFR
jgi:hypothetical protein